MVIQFPGNAQNRKSRPARQTNLSPIVFLQTHFPDIAQTRPELLFAIGTVLDRAQAAVADKNGDPPTGR